MIRTMPTSYYLGRRAVLPELSKATARMLQLRQYAEKQQKVKQQLKVLDVSWYGLMTSEAQELPTILHDEEVMRGVVHGTYEDGYAMLIATDHRVLFIDKKPFFVKADEVTYDTVGGLTYGKLGSLATVTLHTRIGDYKLKTLNYKSARHFIDYIESRCLERQGKQAAYYD